MKHQSTLSNVMKILICLGILYLSGLAFYALVLATDLSSNIAIPFHMGSLVNPVFIVFVGMLILIILLGVTFLFTTNKSIDSLFHWVLLFLAFSTLPDILQITQMTQSIQIGDGRSYFAVDFDLLANLSLLGEFPKELFIVFILLYGIVRADKFYLKKKEIVLLTLSLLLCVTMLFLPKIAHILLFIAVYCLIILAHVLFEQFVKQVNKRSEKIVAACIVAVLIGKCVYRALLIINSYLI